MAPMAALRPCITKISNGIRTRTKGCPCRALRIQNQLKTQVQALGSNTVCPS